MTRRTTLYGVFILLFLSIWGCNKASTSPEPKEATPYALNLPNYFSTRSDTLEAPLTVEGIALGKMLFSDSGLSSDGKVSCKSCHVPEHAFSDPRRVSLGVRGQAGTRQSMALVNLPFQSHFFWDGRATSLEEMLIQPITRPDEMDMTATTVEAFVQKAPYPSLFAAAFKGQQPSFLLTRRAISMYIRSLVSGNSKYDLALRGLCDPTDSERRGQQLFFTHPDARAGIRGGNCGDCHQTITTAGSTLGFNGLKNNGLDINTNNDYGLERITGKAEDRGRFKVPSLRNIALSAPYMHDGRFTTLEQVLDHYNSPTLLDVSNIDLLLQNGSNMRNGASLGLTDQEKADIISFLHMLTDTTYLH